MQLDKLRQQFWQQGYLLLEDFFDAELMDVLQNKIMQHYGTSPVFSHNEEFLSKAATEVVPWFPQREGELAFDVVEQDSRLQQLSAALLGQDWRSLYCMSMFSKGGSKGQAWHQDCPPEDNSRFNLNRLVYTMDIDAELGGEVLIKPASHMTGALTVGEVNEDFADQITLRPKKGTLVIIHGHTWHRVLPVKGAYRVSTNFRAVPHNTPENITDICVYRNMRYQFSTSQVVEERLVK